MMRNAVVLARMTCVAAALGVAALLAASGTEALGEVISFTSTPQYMPQSRTVVASLAYSSSSMTDPFGGTQYDTTATYDALSSGTRLRFYTTDSWHAYGPYGSSDSWSSPSDGGGYSSMNLLQNSSGGRVTLMTLSPVTAVNYDATVYENVLSGYENTITYGALPAGTRLVLSTSDTFHVYGPYGSQDAWSSPSSDGTYASLTSSASTAGGSVMVYTSTPVTSVAVVPEPSCYAITTVATGFVGLMRWRKRWTGEISA